jgi:hypothetical protein
LSYSFDRDLGFWELPKPDMGAEKIWHPVVRVAARVVPFGYEVDPDNDKLFKPIPQELEALELAKKHLKQYSYREVSAWLTTQSGKSISHMGLKKRVDLERKRKTTARIKRELAKRLQEAITQYETLEKERTGYYTCPAE